MSQPPPKPWERPPGTLTAPLHYRSPDFSTAPLAAPPVLTRVAPPVPPRPVQQTYRPSYSSFPSSYGTFGSSMYGGYSPYSYGGYGGYGLGYGRPHAEDVPPSRFVRHAEESSRGAFQSVESIVHAFASVSMMLDATFSAVYNSFRAVLDVANHFSRLRVHFSKVLSAFALVRTLRYLYRRLQRALGVRTQANAEDLWADSVAEGSVVPASGPGSAGGAEARVKSWPIFLFLAVVFGGPYLIWKLLRAEEGVEERGTNWANGEDDHVVAKAEYDFTAASEEEISFQAGNMLNLAPKDQQPRVRGWLLASLDGQAVGLVPANHVKILGKRRGRRPAEPELPQLQEGQQRSLSSTGAGGVAASETRPYPNTGGVATSETRPFPEELLEAAYKETPVSYAHPVVTTNTTATNAALGTERVDL
ncbi:peroxisome biogenesis factor 13 [Brachyhypopomus gauderio]|uniref:peroxisome biogenesis factor 13 n=1 Tax=Brachyhypopomus gauderio TaxID=698409 RepID=UPI004041947C